MNETEVSSLLRSDFPLNMPKPKRKVADPEPTSLWPVGKLAEFMARNPNVNPNNYRKEKLFNLLSGHALALLQAFLEVKSVAARRWFMKVPWPEAQDDSLVPGTARWIEKVKFYIKMALSSVGPDVPDTSGLVVATLDQPVMINSDTQPGGPAYAYQ